MQAKDGHVAKFMPRFDGLYEVLQAHPEALSYTLQLPPSSKALPTFHISHLHRHFPNDNKLFLGPAQHTPKPLVTVDGTTEYFINQIINQRPRGRGYQFLVCWSGYGPEHDLWPPRLELIDTEALAKWEADNQN
jgi:hypothetical protein